MRLSAFRTGAAALVAALAITACQPSPSTVPVIPSPTTAAEAEAPATPEEMEAMRLRGDWGLQSDLAFVRQVAADPSAVSEPFGVPFLPAEILEMQRRAVGQEPVKIAVNREAERVPADFCGLYIDNEHGGKVVSMWKANLHTHAINIAFDLSSFEYLAFEPCRYSETELNAISARLLDPALDVWLRALPAVATGWGTDTSANRIEMNISSAVPGAAELVRQHIVAAFGLPDDILVVTSDGTGAVLRPWGKVLITVVRPNGKPVGDNDLNLDWGGEPGGLACGEGDIGFGVNPNGVPTELPCQEGSWTIFVKGIPWPDEDWQVYGTGKVTVAGGHTVKLMIRLDREPPAPR